MGRRRSRAIATLTVSALDLFAMAVGSFILITVVLLPFYQQRATTPAGDTPRAESAGDALPAAEPGEDGAERMRALRAAAAAARERAAALAAAATAAQTDAAESAASAAQTEAETEKLEAQAHSLAASVLPAPKPAARPVPSPRSGPPIPEALDLVFVVDATSSMEPAIELLAESMAGLVQLLDRMVPSLQVGIVAYRDYDVKGPVVEALPLTDTSAGGLQRVVGFLEQLPVLGGRTSDEAVVEGLERARRLDFRQGSRRLMLVLGDAKAHAPQREACFAAVSAFARSAAKASVVTLWVPTPNALRYSQGDRAFFQALAAAGNGIFSDRLNALSEAVIVGLLEQ